MTDLEARVAALEAKDEVRAAVAAYCTANDKRTALDELLDLFTEDAVMHNAAGVHTGRDAIAAYYAAFFDGSVTFARHHVLNQVVTLIEPGVATHDSYFIAFLGKGGVSRMVFGRYADTLVKTPDGWKYRKKVNDVVLSTTPGAGWLDGVETPATATAGAR